MNNKPKSKLSMADLIGVAVAGFFMPFVIDQGLGAIPVMLIFLGIYWIVRTIANFIIEKRSAKV